MRGQRTRAAVPGDGSLGVANPIDGLRIGHWTDVRALTGCTVVLVPPGSTGSGLVLGRAPATRETDLLRPGALVERVDAVVLAGGSAFGLAAADGVVRYLEERAIGFDTGVARVPIVPAAALFDLSIGDASVRPAADSGYAACEAASADLGLEGNIGAGTGATVGKSAGPAYAMKGGLGYGAATDGEVSVLAVAAVNAFGDVIDDEGRVLAGARSATRAQVPFGNTTLCCVVTDADLGKAQLERVATLASGGLARAVRPVFTMVDGDVVFALATRRRPAAVDVVGALAADATASAVRRGVLEASSVDGVPACRDATVAE